MQEAITRLRNAGINQDGVRYFSTVYDRYGVSSLSDSL
jgi:hypothetical protein